MLEKGRISGFQTILLLINLVTATAVMLVPSISTSIAGRDAWLTPMVATLPAIYQALIICSLGKKFPGQTLIQYLQTVFYTWPGKALGLSYLFFFIHTNSIIVREFGELIKHTIMPQTPLVVFNVVILLLCAYAISGGLEVLARIIEIAIPYIIIMVMLLVALTAKDANLNNLLPILENGLLPVFNASLVPSAWRGEVILLAMFLPYLAKPEQAKRYAIIVQILICFLVSVNIIAMIAVLGPNSTARLSFSTYSLIRDYSIGRSDAFVIILWVTSIFGKVSLFYYATAIGTAQLFNLKDYRNLVLPIGILLSALSTQVVQSNIELVEYLSKPFPPFAYVFEYVIPTIILVIAKVRGMKNN